MAAGTLLFSKNQPGGIFVMGDAAATTGSVFFAHSGTGVDAAGYGLSPDSPTATIDYAVGLCTANKGDRIYVMPGHTETIATAGGLTLDVAGVSVIGIPNGGAKPIITFTATASTCLITAAGVVMENLTFTSGINAVVNAINIAAADVTLKNIETRETSTFETVDFIVTTAAADRLTIDGWKHYGSTSAGADTAISIVGGSNLVIRNFNIWGAFAVACIENVTTACTNATIGGGSGWNYLRTYSAADVLITMVATSTVNIGPNIAGRLTDDAANITEAYVAADGNFYQPLPLVNADGESSLNTNITASTDA